MNPTLVTAKAITLIVASISHYIGLRPPQPPNPDKVYRGQHFETMVLIWAFASWVTIGALAFSNALVIMALLQQPGDKHAQRILGTFCPYPSDNIHTITHIDPVFMLGITMMLLACGLRVWCYITLGRMFTFRVGTIPGHKLVTSGPYAYARHPSYTGVFFMLLGVAVTFLVAPNNYIRECGIMMTPWRWLAVYWCVCVCFSIFSLVNRGRVEDELMGKTFGIGWQAYGSQVPYKFIPFIF